MTTTRSYLSTDSGAPVLTGQVDSLISLLKTCLVGVSGTAYGSKDAAGWSNPFDDPTNHITVLQNSVAAGGSGACVRILDDGSGTSATAANAHMNCYSSMSGISTGNDITPAAVAGWPGVRIEKSTAANSTAVPWELYADERTFYLATITGTAANSTFYGAGDYESFVPGFAYAIFCGGGRATTSNSDRGSAFSEAASTLSATTGRINLMREYSGAAGAVSRDIIGPRSGASANRCWGNGDFPAQSSALSNATLGADAMIGSGIGIMGRFRGLKVPLINVTGLALPATLAGSAAGSSLRLLRQTSSWSSYTSTTGGGILVETALPWQ